MNFEKIQKNQYNRELFTLNTKSDHLIFLHHNFNHGTSNVVSYHFTQIYDKWLILSNFDTAKWYNNQNVPIFFIQKNQNKNTNEANGINCDLWYDISKVWHDVFYFTNIGNVVLIGWPKTNSTAKLKVQKENPLNQEKGKNVYERAWVVNQANFIRIEICAIKIFDKVLRHISWIAIYKT